MVALYGQSLSSFIALAADNFEMLVYCARGLCDISGVCSNLASISPILFGKHTAFFNRFLTQM
jgi:hypothetical protein